mgnify:CR=1 FL=1
MINRIRDIRRQKGMTLADVAARTVAAPMQLPVGVITALVGAPVFIVLLRKGASR